MRGAHRILLLLLVWITGSDFVRAQVPGPVTPDQVKAAFLYNFAAFVTWPPGSGAENAIVIGVMNAPELESELRRTTATVRTSQERTVSVRSVKAAGDAAGIHILYIGVRENARLGAHIAALANRPILVVTDAPDGLERGSMINFVISDRVQFEVSLEAAARADLHLSSRLLSVASRIRKGEQGRTTIIAWLPQRWRGAVSAPRAPERSYG